MSTAELTQMMEIAATEGATDTELTRFLGKRLQPGGAFILDTPAAPVPLWGSEHEVLFAEGESLLIVGGQGTGKTTLAQQLALGRAGFAEYAELLGYPIKAGSRSLYLGMDRPRQAARSFRRMVGSAWRAELDRQLVVWEGPPPFDFSRHPELLTQLAQAARADTVVVDSLKDAFLGLIDDEAAAGWNRARQLCLREGVQLVELHHQRKAGSSGRSAIGLDDVYGSTWITSGVGSVLLLEGSPGDPVVGLRHLKQPDEPVGPLRLLHDHEIGRTTIWHVVDLLALAAAAGGLSALDAARALFESDKPTLAEKEKARRRLDQLVRQGLLTIVDEGDRSTSRPRLWGLR